MKQKFSTAGVRTTIRVNNNGTDYSSVATVGGQDGNQYYQEVQSNSSSNFM